MGPVNLMAEQRGRRSRARMAGLQHERAELTEAIARLRRGISALDQEGRQAPDRRVRRVSTSISPSCSRGCSAAARRIWRWSTMGDPLVAGLEIMASPPGKRLQSLSLLSGGEQALTALALLFAVFLTNPAPVCVLDEVDAPLDDANVDRFCRLVGDIADTTGTRFLVDHPSPHHDGADGPPVRRDDGRTRRLAARLGRSRPRRPTATNRVSPRRLPAISVDMTGPLCLVRTAARRSGRVQSAQFPQPQPQGHAAGGRRGSRRPKGGASSSCPAPRTETLRPRRQARG